ncbi:Sb-PDE family phosphodiesterase [Flavilitoribacter nigricans]|uniref:PHP domain-containing protein n=1 Tax=Flavilitoribacter nigricans (strain ATCC 23147 / DSM 23189 / NBRC 102662 / NCIMB 1420 / SS-2) TaxID=1122177 RepID=A0A2D0N5F5_FLAN2|nr:Sb-PDE family phosphodiesterase [Flavilitoribacter nigricans]PHN03616.1 PHP domain-containing protein [Flavilitoribacter nigricans DSM 23189 = NBRC 102662]
MRSITLIILLLAGSLNLIAQTENAHGHPHRHIEFPDVPDYLTVVCDLHQHTVFSDGNVWPTIRVEEALRDGIDAISLTEHLEYQPHGKDIPHPDRNRSFEIVKKFANANDILIIHGAEITRRMPPGHCNAIFIEDANKLLVDDSLEVFRAAKAQNAFVFWNHPNWTSQRPDGISRLTPFHKKLISDNLLHGIEVVNEHTYSAEALQIALENDLTIMGTSDIHGLIDWDYQVQDGTGHRPVTLVFATDRSESAVKEALLARRTAVWFNNTLIGKEENLLPLLHSCLKLQEATYQTDKTVADVTIENRSDADLILENLSPYTLHRHANLVTLKAHEKTTLEVKTVDLKDTFNLKFRVLNAIIAPNEHPVVTFPVEME